MDVDVRRPLPAVWDGALRNPPAASQIDLPRPKKRSPNRIKAKPANPAVISSIISSLDNLTPPLPSSTDSDSASRHSRPYSSEGTVVSAASVRRSVTSPGFGVEYGNSLALADDDGLSDAALPPTIPTARAPSGLSQYTAPRSPAFGLSAGEAYGAVLSSRRSSFSSSSVRSASNTNKLSAESWVRKYVSGDDRKSSHKHEASRGRAPVKALRRLSSQDVLRPRITPPREESVDSPPVSLAEQIIARTPPPSSAASRGRLYLRDSTIGEDRMAAAPPPPIAMRRSKDTMASVESKYSSGERYRDSVTEPAVKYMADDRLTPVRVSTLKSPSPISDSIPTRTSSLRQASSSPSSTRRNGKKSKRSENTTIKGESSSYKRSKAIPESSWADLGDDDETVRRIRELREQRKSRLEEHNAYVLPREVSDEDMKSVPAIELPSETRWNGQPAVRPKPVVTPEPRNKAHKVLGVGVATPTGLPYNGTAYRSATYDSSWRPGSPSDVQRPYSAQQRPSTAVSDNFASPSLSLDYSYAEAVDVLQDIERDTGPLSDLPSTQDAPKSIPLRGANATRTVSGSVSPTQRRPDSRKLKKHPKGDKRRSVEIRQEDSTLMRVDSIEDAALDFLQAPRLSRRVQNPITRRTLAFSEVGDPNGAAVFVCVGMGLTRYVTAFYDELATTLRLRLITVDRPGVGGSEPYPPSDKSGPLGWPEDILAICECLNVSKFSLVAHSAGAVYALATALILPHMVKGKVHLLAPWIPPSQLEAISHPASSAPPAGALPRAQRLLRVLPTPLLRAANSSFMAASSASLKPAHKRRNGQTPPRKSNELQSAAAHRVRETGADGATDLTRRESFMLMDHIMPATNPTDTFGLAGPSPDDVVTAALRRGSLAMSATATPTDPSFRFASSALNAAEHAERERELAYTSRLTELTWELATRDSNPATDLLVCLERHRDVGFRYTDVARQVVITHGAEDKRVPLANVRWVAEQMNRHAALAPPAALGPDGDGVVPESRDGWADASSVRAGCEVRALMGEGHGLMANPVIMGDILTEIAGYWNDRKRGPMA